MMLFRKNWSSILGYLGTRSKNLTLFSSPYFLTPLSLFTSEVHDPSLQTPFIVKYLIDCVGLSSVEAAKASKSITSIKGPSQPDSVLKFFKNNGFTDTDIKRIIFLNPILLCAKADSTLKLKFDALRELGFSETHIVNIITANPFCLKYLSYCNLRPRIEFLSGFLHSNDDIVKALSMDVCLLSHDLEKNIKPNFAFLRECQISDEKIRFILKSDQRLMGRSLNSLKNIAKRVDELGVPCESGMFFYAFRTLSKINSDLVDAKIKFMGSLGFSSDEIVSIILRNPGILSLSAKNVCETVNFLVKEAGCTLSYLSRNSSIIGLSLTKRLIPRNYVMQLIREKGLLKNELSFYSIVSMSERRFLEKFIYYFQEKMPDLPYVYLSSSSAIIMEGKKNDGGEVDEMEERQ